MLYHNVHTILSNHTLRIVLSTYILNVLHIVRSPPIANGSVRQANLTEMMSMERREWFKRRKQTEASLAGKQRTSMSKMTPHLILQTRNAYFAQRDGLKDKLDQARRNREIIAQTETWHIDMHTTTFFMKIQDISYCKAGRICVMVEA